MNMPLSIYKRGDDEWNKARDCLLALADKEDVTEQTTCWAGFHE